MASEIFQESTWLLSVELVQVVLYLPHNEVINGINFIKRLSVWGLERDTLCNWI